MKSNLKRIYETYRNQLQKEAEEILYDFKKRNYSSISVIWLKDRYRYRFKHQGKEILFRNVEEFKKYIQKVNNLKDTLSNINDTIRNMTINDEEEL